jgi:RNA polymerase sigma-70 factor (ECF subfamily)
MRWITTTQLLHELRERSEAPAWDALSQHFRPVIEHFALHLGLSHDQAQDAAQETLLAFVKAFRQGKYDRDHGRLSAWLFGIARNTIRRQYSREARHNNPNALSDASTNEDFLKQTWETQWRRILLARCLTRVQQETDPAVYEAFRLYALEDQSAEQVARHLDISRNAVYIAKSRVLSHVRSLIQQLDDPEAV